jgi:MoxR-like ATPase
MDRFMLKVNVDYPDAAAELAIIDLVREGELGREYISPLIKSYVVNLVMATRVVGDYSNA